jgi:uncharacterized protein (TIGR02452 family)
MREKSVESNFTLIEGKEPNMGRTENVEVFEDTQRCCKTDPELIRAIEHSNQRQKLILEQEQAPMADRAKYTEPAKILVTRNRTFQAASGYADQKVCVLNFASASNPGGGVTRGSSAQEEGLCRCSTLYFSLTEQFLWSGFYAPHRRSHDPLHNDDCIYTPDVVVFKSDGSDPKQLPRQDWYQVNVVTCAAPNLRERPSNAMNTGDGDRPVHISNAALQALHEKRMRRILDIAAANENEVVVLGAFGCGAFSNPPEIVATAMKNVVQEYRHCFKTIEFAVYCSPRDDSNYRVFHRVLGN